MTDKDISADIAQFAEQCRQKYPGQGILVVATTSQGIAVSANLTGRGIRMMAISLLTHEDEMEQNVQNAIHSLSLN